MYQYLNLHPEGKRVGDCVKRAIAKALEKDYKEVSLELNRFKKVSGTSTYNHPDNYKKYLESLGAIYIPFPAYAGEPRMNGKRFAQDSKKGTYILRMAKHLSVCVDGIIYDTWDCSDKCVYGVWLIKNEKEGK